MPITTFLGSASNSLNTNLSNISQQGIDAIAAIVEDLVDNGDLPLADSLEELTDVSIDQPLQFSQVLFYDNIGFNPGQWHNRLLTTSLINEPQVSDPPNKYFTIERARDYIKSIMTNQGDLLTRDVNGNLIALNKGSPNQILAMSNDAPSVMQWIDKTAINLGLDDLTDVEVTSPFTSDVLMYINNRFTNSKLFLSDIGDVNLASPVDSDVLIYQNGNFENRSLAITDITNLQAQLNNKVNVTEYTATGDITFADAANSVARLPISTPGKVLKVSPQSLPEWGDASETLDSLTDVTITNVANNQFLRYTTNTNEWTNQNITTADIPENTNLYYTDQRVADTLLSILTANEDILIRRGDEIARLPVTTDTSKYLGSDGTQLEWKTIPPSGATILDELGDVTLTAVATGNVLYKSAGNWINQTLGIADITNLSSSLAGKVSNLFTTRGDLIVGGDLGSYVRLGIGGVDTYLKSDGADLSWSSVPAGYTDADVEAYIKTILTTQDDLLIRGATNLERLAKGVDGTVLKVVNGNIEWGNITINLKDLSDANITNENLAGWLYWNSTELEWQKHVISIGNVTDLQTTLDGKIPLNTVTTAGDLIVGDGNASVTRLGKGTDNQVLSITNGAVSWETPSTSNITEGTNLYYTDGRVDTRISSKFTAKGRLLAGTGNTAYEQVSAPDVDFKVLVSDLNNVLAPTGLSWSQLALNNSYFSNLNIGTLANNHILVYNSTSTKWENKIFTDPTLLLPFQVPNNNAYWGSANIPFRVNSATSGIGTRFGGGVTVLYHNGIEAFACDGTYCGPGGSLRMSLTAGGTAAAPRMMFGINGCGWFSSGATTETLNWCGNANHYGSINNTALKTNSRLDVKNTIIDDYRIRINNIFNLFAFQNTDGTNTYLQVETTNNRVRLPNRFVSSIEKVEGAPVLGTSITTNNDYKTLFLSDATQFTVTNNALSTPMSVSMTANTDEFQINNATGIKLKMSISFSLLIDKNVSLLELTLWNMTADTELTNFHRRFRGDANYYINYNAESYIIPPTATMRISIKIRINQGATMICNLHNTTILVEDCML